MKDGKKEDKERVQKRAERERERKENERERERERRFRISITTRLAFKQRERSLHDCVLVQHVETDKNSHLRPRYTEGGRHSSNMDGAYIHVSQVAPSDKYDE